jgi:riboflavin kinase/FMN adenylyltransferase
VLSKSGEMERADYREPPMEVIRDPAAFSRPASGSAVTIGAYDGVHLGHRALIGQVRDVAAARELRSVVVTFDRHPAEVVRPSSAPKLLTDLEQKLELLATTGVDATLVVHFDEARAHEPAEDFVTEILVDTLNAKVVSVGADFHFGHRRRGNVALLEAMGATSGFDVLPIELVSIPGVDGPVSSTRIRGALAGGDVEFAAQLLGRLHEVRGTAHDGVVDVPDDILVPAAGVYAGWYRTGRAVLPAVVDVGERVVLRLLDGGDAVDDEHCGVSFRSRLATAVGAGDEEARRALGA